MSPTRRRLLALSGLALAGGLAGCTARTDGGTEPTLLTSDRSRTVPTVPESRLAELVRGNTAFALDLLGAQVDSDAGNLFFSPYSLSLALAMTWAGARGTTETEMADALSYTLGQDRLHPAFNALDRRIERADEGESSDSNGSSEEASTEGGASDERRPFTLRTTNALWGQAGYPFRDAYLDTLAVNYGAGVYTVDFVADSEAARRTINSEIRDQTEGVVEELLPQGVVTDLTRFVLTNAIYFDADWQRPFPKERTERGLFTALDGSESQVRTMHQSGTFPYAEVDGTQVVELPYVGDTVSMVVVLPPAGEFTAFEASLDAATLTALTDALGPRSGDLALPRFTVEATLGLRESLSSLGMPTAFDPGEANFGGMIDLDAAEENLFLQAVVHQCRVAVDEAGTEAAAATGVVGGATSAPMNPFELTVDRPFLAFIRHRDTDAVLFLGRVVDAAAAQ